MILLKEYQRNAVNQLNDCTQSLLQSSADGDKLCIFQAPTGSGKTVMAAKYIEEMLLADGGENLCFIWISVGKGDLHGQSKRSLTHIFQEFPKVSLYEEEYHGSKDSLDFQSVTVVNWEKLRNKDKKTGDWKNTLMKDAEYFNFREVLPNTKAKGAKIIAIIDESHIGAGAARTTELREIINADVWIEVSATPKSYDSQKLKELKDGDDSPIKINRTTYFVYVNADDVIKEGMIKHDVIVNESLNKFNVEEEDSESLILHAAFEKRLALKTAYQKENVNINPLVLIQIENADAGSETMRYVKSYLDERGIEKDNIAIWLSGEKSESIANISDNDNHIEYLIFKQAIDTGWDCPRAQILVKFREIQSEIFATQVLGRILRMPEQKYYQNDDLNIAYIFTNLQRFDEDDKTGIPNLIKTLSSKRKDTYQSLSLTSFYKKRVDYGDLTSSFHEVLETAFCEHFGISFRPDFINSAENEVILNEQNIDLTERQRLDWILNDVKIDISNLGDNESIKELTQDKHLDVKIAERKLLNMLNNFLSVCLSGRYAKERSLPTIRAAIYNWFRDYLGINPFGAEKSAIRIQAILLKTQNNEAFHIAIDKALADYDPIKKSEVEEKSKEDEEWNYNWDLPLEEFFSDKSDEKVKQIAYSHYPCFLSKTRSTPEHNFEDFLEDNDTKIEWWWKNKDFGKEYFGIKYLDEAAETRTFYPDYLVQFKSGQLGIFDTKSGITAQTAKYRAEALQAYIKEENAKGKKLIGGILEFQKNLWRINQDTFYDYHKGNWLYFSDFLQQL